MFRIRVSPISGWGFLALFPGFFFYNYLLANGYIGSVLGGYFGIVALALAPLITFVYFRHIKIGLIRINRIDAIFFILLLYIAIVALINYANGRGVSVDAELFKNTVAVVYFNVILFLVARTVDFKDRFLKKMNLVALASMFILLVINIGDFGIYRAQLASSASDGISTYQGLGRSIAVVSIFSLATSKSKFSFYTIGLISLGALFFNGARSELVGTIAAFFFILINKFKMRQLFLIAIALSLSVLLLASYLPIEAFERNRVFQLMSLDEASSAIARAEMMRDGLKTIYANPIFGDYGSYAYGPDSGIGTNVHNLLSAWVDLGFLGFAFYVVCLSSMGYVIISNSGNPNKSIDLHLLAVGYFSCIGLLLIFSKGYGYMLFGLSMGFVARIVNDNRRRNRRAIRVNELIAGTHA